MTRQRYCCAKTIKVKKCHEMSNGMNGSHGLSLQLVVGPLDFYVPIYFLSLMMHYRYNNWNWVKVAAVDHFWHMDSIHWIRKELLAGQTNLATFGISTLFTEVQAFLICHFVIPKDIIGVWGPLEWVGMSWIDIRSGGKVFAVSLKRNTNTQRHRVEPQVPSM